MIRNNNHHMKLLYYFVEYNIIEYEYEYYLFDFLLMFINISKKENWKNYLEIWKIENVIF